MLLEDYIKPVDKKTNIKWGFLLGGIYACLRYNKKLIHIVTGLLWADRYEDKVFNQFIHIEQGLVLLITSLSILNRGRQFNLLNKHFNLSILSTYVWLSFVFSTLKVSLKFKEDYDGSHYYINRNLNVFSIASLVLLHLLGLFCNWLSNAYLDPIRNKTHSIIFNAIIKSPKGYKSDLYREHRFYWGRHFTFNEDEFLHKVDSGEYHIDVEALSPIALYSYQRSKAEKAHFGKFDSIPEVTETPVVENASPENNATSGPTPSCKFKLSI